MSAVPIRRASLFAAIWAFGTTAAFTVSGFAFHFPGAFPPNNGDSFNANGFLGALINGILTGTVIGLSQMFLLRMVGIRSWRWAAGTVVGLWLVHTIGDVFPDGTALTLMALVGGFLLGALQWWALEWPAGRGLLWLAATAFPWSLGLWLSSLLAGTDWRMEHILAGLISGALTGTTTAVAWLWILNTSRSKETGTNVAVSG